MSKLSTRSKAFRTAAIMFSISGLIFITLAIVAGEIGAFLPVGIALLVISIVYWQLSRKPLNNNEDEEKPN